MTSHVLQGYLDQINAEHCREGDEELFDRIRELPGVESVEYVQILSEGLFQAHIYTTDDVDDHRKEFDPYDSRDYGDPLSVVDVRECVQ